MLTSVLGGTRYGRLRHVDFPWGVGNNLWESLASLFSIARPTRWGRERLLELLYPVLSFAIVGISTILPWSETVLT